MTSHARHTPSASDSPVSGGSWSIRLTDREAAWLERRLTNLTPRERDVVRELCLGGSNEAVAERLYVALPTLRTHLMRINQKLGTRGKGDVVRYVVGFLLESYRNGQIGSAGTSLNGAVTEVKGLGGSVSAHGPEKSSFPMTTVRAGSSQ